MNEMCSALSETERNGIAIDIDELDNLESKYRALQNELSEELQQDAQSAMGDTPVNLASSAQLSNLLYSRKVKDKKVWALTFNLGTELRNGVRKPKYPRKYPYPQFIKLVNELTEPVYKTKASHCSECEGSGRVAKLRKDGTYGAARYICKSCSGNGIIYTTLGTRAGFGLKPTSSMDLSTHGFKTDSDTIQRLSQGTRNDKTRAFATKMAAHSSIATYLSTYITGIRRGVRGNNRLHTSFMQAVTKTGRLSSRNPNFHNQPRGTICEHCRGAKCRYCLETGYKFPIRRVVISRWSGGSIIKADYSKLEFVIAMELSRDPVGIKKLSLKNFDPHKDSSREIGVDRQSAKEHTFKPIYGGTSGTARERRYYRWFASEYSGHFSWQQALAKSVLKYKIVRLPSGREYSFPTARQMDNGRITNFTNICNYPVQGFATGDIVQAAYIEAQKAFKTYKLKSLLINEVHDEIVVDCYPGEEHKVAWLVNSAMLSVPDVVVRRYGYQMVVPLQVEVSYGKTWMETKKVPEEWLKSPPPMKSQLTLH